MQCYIQAFVLLQNSNFYGLVACERLMAVRFNSWERIRGTASVEFSLGIRMSSESATHSNCMICNLQRNFSNIRVLPTLVGFGSNQPPLTPKLPPLKPIYQYNFWRYWSNFYHLSNFLGRILYKYQSSYVHMSNFPCECHCTLKVLRNTWYFLSFLVRTM